MNVIKYIISMLPHNIKLFFLFAFITILVIPSANANDSTTLPGCEFSFKFPTTPRMIEYKANGRLGHFLMTDTKYGLPMLRAECQAIQDRSLLSNDLIMTSLEQQAESVGLTNIQVTLENNELGLVGTYTGTKKTSGFKMVQSGKIYVGKTSVLNILVVEKLINFPSKRTNTFIYSVKIKNQKHK